jgi:hypothetical protein
MISFDVEMVFPPCNGNIDEPPDPIDPNYPVDPDDPDKPGNGNDTPIIVNRNPIFFLANGTFIANGRSWSTTQGTVRLSVSQSGKVNQETLTLLGDGGGAATLEGNVLTFHRAGTARIGYSLEGQTGWVDITGVFAATLSDRDLAGLLSLNSNGIQYTVTDELKGHIHIASGLEIFLGQERELNYRLSSILDFYDFSWTSSCSNLVITEQTDSKLSFRLDRDATPGEQVFLMLTLDATRDELYDRRQIFMAIPVTVGAFGPISIAFELNRASYTDNFERMYVFGTMAPTHDLMNHFYAFDMVVFEGQNQNINYSVTGSQGVSVDNSILGFDAHGRRGIWFNRYWQANNGAEYITVEVTATATNRSPLSIHPATAVYTFHIVPNAVNVESYDQLVHAVNARQSVVLQRDIATLDRVVFPRSLYGNNFLLDGTHYSNTVNDMARPCALCFCVVNTILPKTISLRW